MQQLHLNDMEAIHGGNPCLEAGIGAMGLFAETGVGALFAGIIVYSACSLIR